MRTVPVERRPPEKRSQVHGQHADVLNCCGIVVNESNFSGNRDAVVVHVKGTHEYPYQNLGTGYVLPGDVIESGFHTTFDIDHAFLRLHLPDVDHRAVSRAENS